MKKRILGLLLVIYLVAGMLPTVAYAEGGTSHEGLTELTKEILESTYKVSSELGDYYKLPDGHYYLGENISLDKRIDIGDSIPLLSPTPITTQYRHSPLRGQP